MQIFSYETLESTSDHAVTMLIEQNLATPFVVTARQQTKGRGRQGHTWLSPAGNLYFSIALKPKQEDLANLSVLPLKVGVILAEWIKQECGFNVTLKWPNDILFAGAKLGGILCESSIQGGALRSLIVGIGLNINALPSGDLPYPAISLAQISGHSWDIEGLLQRFCYYWETFAAKLSWEELPTRWQSFSMPIGHLWQERHSGSLVSFQGIDAAGNMVLSPLGEGQQRVSVGTAQHDYEWIYQRRDNNLPVFVADVGNTRIKIARFARQDASEPEQVMNVSPDAIDLMALRNLLGPHQSFPIFAISVNDAHLASLSSACKELGVELVLMSKRRVRSQDGGYDFQNLGSDRLAAMEGALANAQGPMIVVSSGTALTLDVIDAHGRHLGGWIVPGVETSFQALHASTHALPEVSFEHENYSSNLLGCDTQSAIRDGVRFMLGAFISRAQQFANGVVGDQETKLFLTGGNAADLLDLNYSELIQDQYLVLHGVKVMALGG